MKINNLTKKFGSKVIFNNFSLETKFGTWYNEIKKDFSCENNCKDPHGF